MVKMKITFKSITENHYDIAEKPYPAVTAIPEWFKNIKPSTSSEHRNNEPKGQLATVKKCFPILDSLTSGYIIPAPVDLLVRYVGNDDIPTITWNSFNINWVETWQLDQSAGFEIPDGFNKQIFKLINPWLVQTPKNWSCLFTHPIGYPNLPFRAITGIVDTDKLKTDINQPFVLKKRWEGIIEAGTPIVQIIPFERKDWEMDCKRGVEKDHRLNQELLMKKISGSYGKLFHTKKRYK